MPESWYLNDNLLTHFVRSDDCFITINHPNRFRGNVAEDVREYIGDGFHFMGANGGSSSMSSYNIFFQMIC